MRSKQFRSICSIAISLTICVLPFVSCSNDNLLIDPPVAPVTALTLSVDKADFKGDCPHTFKFTGTITSGGPGRITYVIKDIKDLDDFLSESKWFDFDAAGTQTVTAEFELNSSWKGEAMLEIRGLHFTSNIVPFTATCN